ncbi:MAG: hypothetical protein KTR31_20150 [Myxococcales bacterium]|nr:hypothetical protein [Myxococcales bacterium]
MSILLIGAVGCDETEAEAEPDAARGRATQIGAEEFVDDPCPTNVTDGWGEVEPGGPTFDELGDGLVGAYDVALTGVSQPYQELGIELRWPGRGGGGKAGVGDDCDAWAIYDLAVSLASADRPGEVDQLLGSLRYVRVDGVWRVLDAVASVDVRDTSDLFRHKRSADGELVMVLDGRMAEAGPADVPSWPSPGTLSVALDEGGEQAVASW